MTSSKGKMFKNYVSMHWNYLIQQVTKSLFGVSYMYLNLLKVIGIRSMAPVLNTGLLEGI